MKIEIFFCANRYAKTLTSNTLEFIQLAQLFSQPFVSDEKDGSGMFPGHYKYPYRQLQNIDYHNFIILDIDDHNESEKLLNLVRHQNEYLYKFNFIIYSTFSSKSNNLRLRLILEVDINEIDDNSIITIDDYPAATRTVEAALGIISDPSSHKRNSFVYTPRIPPHTEFIFYNNLDAEPFRKTDINKKWYNVSNTARDDFIDFVTNRDNSVYNTEEIPEELIMAMLDSIDPDVEYNTWFKILTALHHYSDGAEWGFQLANRWSSRGGKYEGDQELWYKWASINDEVETPVTIGTLIYIANQNDWHGKYLFNIAAEFRREIQEDKTKFASEDYVYKFCKRISKHQFSSVTRSSLVNELTAAASEMMMLDKRTRTKLLKEIENRSKYGGLTRDMTAQERKEMTPAWAKEYVIVTGLSTDVRFARINNPFDPEMGSILLNNDRFNAENIHHKTEPAQDLALLAREFYDLPHVQTIKFDPSAGTIFHDRTGKSCLNSFVRNESFYYGSKSNFTSMQTSIINHIERFMEFFLPDNVQRHIFLNYMAYNIFFLGKKVQWAPIVITTEGYGKDTVMHLIEVALGRYRKHFLKIDGLKFFDPQWTSILEHRSFVHVNEVYVTSSAKSNTHTEREKIYNVIKDRITDADSLRISTKYQNDRVIQQVTNYSFTSNALDALAFPSTERRLLVLWPERYHDDFKTSKENIKESLSNIWDMLHAFGIGGHNESSYDNTSITKKLLRESVLSFFGEYARPENWHSEFKPSGEAYRTKEFYEMADLSRDVLQDIVDELIEDEQNPYTTPFYVCLMPYLYQVTEAYKMRNLRNMPTRSELIMALKNRGFIDLADFKDPIYKDIDLKPDITKTFNGVFTGKTKYLMSKDTLIEWKKFFPESLSITEFSRKMLRKWEEYIKFREFQDDPQAMNLARPHEMYAPNPRIDNDIAEFLH